MAASGLLPVDSKTAICRDTSHHHGVIHLSFDLDTELAPLFAGEREKLNQVASQIIKDTKTTIFASFLKFFTKKMDSNVISAIIKMQCQIIEAMKNIIPKIKIAAEHTSKTTKSVSMWNRIPRKKIVIELGMMCTATRNIDETNYNDLFKSKFYESLTSPQRIQYEYLVKQANEIIGLILLVQNNYGVTLNNVMFGRYDPKYLDYLLEMVDITERHLQYWMNYCTWYYGLKKKQNKLLKKCNGFPFEYKLEPNYRITETTYS